MFGDGVKSRIKQQLVQECNLHTIVRLPNSVFKPYATVATNLLFFEKGNSTKDIWFYEHVVPEGQKSYSKTRPIKLEYLDPIKAWWGGEKRSGRVENDFAWKVNVSEIALNGYNLDAKNPNSKNENIRDLEELSTLIQKSDLDLKQEISEIRTYLGKLFGLKHE